MNNDHDQREWEAQERARQLARDGKSASPPLAPRGSGFSRESLHPVELSSTSEPDAESADYRRIADALRRPPPVDLPSDFAVRVARIAEMRAAAPVAKSPRLKPLSRSSALERALTGALMAVFALGAVAVAPVYGARVLAQLQAMVGVQGVQWMALLAGCLGLSWSLDWLRRQARHDGVVRPG